MKLLNEIYRQPSDPNDDHEPSSTSQVEVLFDVAFDHAEDMDKYFEQMVNMGQFKALVEKNFTEAFRQSIREFIKKHGDDKYVGKNWVDDFMGEARKVVKR